MTAELNDWLESIGLGQYLGVLVENDIDLELLSELSEREFSNLGVSLGHRKRIQKALSQVSNSAVKASGNAEHRQLTVMFCDLVDSTPISGRLEAEDYRELILAYQDTCKLAVEQFDGHVAHYQGDGILVYFGYPVAHEDDAERAVFAALGMVAACHSLQQEIGARLHVPVGVRIGICTGSAVVGDLIGEGASQEMAVLGEVPNIAARLQGMAAPGQIIIGAGSMALVQERFELEDLGPQQLKGISDPVGAWRVIAQRDLASSFEAGGIQGETQLVGREAEVSLIMQRWQQCLSGETQAMVLMGDAGLGKSRIIREVKDRLQDTDPNRVLYFCSPHFQHTALYPVSEQLRRSLRIDFKSSPDVILGKLANLTDHLEGISNDDNCISLLAELLNLPAECYSALELEPQQRKSRLLETIVAIIAQMSRTAPVLLVVEDIQWVDPSTESLIQLLLSRLTETRLLVIISCRMDTPPWWLRFPNVTTMSLNHLGAEASRQIIHNVATGKKLPAMLVRSIVEKTDGVPLFVEELTRLITESGDWNLGDSGNPYTHAVPSSLQDSLMARLDRLGEARELAQVAAVLGRRFSHELLASVSGYDADTLSHRLLELQEKNFLTRIGEPPNASYSFNQALSQEVAYQSLLRDKRQEFHRRAAQALMEHFPQLARSEPEQIARHLTESGQAEAAIPWWHNAARSAFRISANHEAISHLQNGLKLLDGVINHTNRNRMELELRLTLGGVLGVIKGWAAKEVGENYFAAQQLCEEHGSDLETFTIKWGLWLYHQQGGRMHAARSLSEEILDLADRLEDSDYKLQAHHAAWTTAERSADFEYCRTHAKQGLALYNPEKHRHHAATFGGHDPGMCAAIHMASTQSEMGLLDQAIKTITEGVTIATEINHPVSLCMALLYTAKLYQTRGESGKCLEMAEKTISIADKYGFAHLTAQALVMQGWALGDAGDLNTGINTIKQGLQALEDTGSRVRLPYFLTLLASLYLDNGDIENAAKAITGARQALDDSGELTQEADLIRVEGEVALKSDDPKRALRKFRQAIDLAKERQALTSGIRAASNLAEVFLHESAPNKACEVLQPFLDQFAEGLETRDLVRARSLLTRAAEALGA